MVPQALFRLRPGKWSVITHVCLAILILEGPPCADRINNSGTTASSSTISIPQLISQRLLSLYKIPMNLLTWLKCGKIVVKEWWETGGNCSLPYSHAHSFKERKPLGTRSALEYLCWPQVAYFRFTSISKWSGTATMAWGNLQLRQISLAREGVTNSLSTTSG